MLKRKLILFFLFSFFSVAVKAQDIVFSNFPQHQFYYNPAFAGVDSGHVFSVTGRRAKDYFDNMPYYNSLLSYNQPLKNFKLGIAASALFHKSDIAVFSQLSFTCNHKFNLGKKMNLRLGARATTGFLHYQTPKNWDYYKQFWEDSIPNISKGHYYFSVGARYEWCNFYFGVSINNLLFNEFYIAGDRENYHRNHGHRGTAIFTIANKFKMFNWVSTTPSIIFSPYEYFQIANDLCLKKTLLLGCAFTPGALALTKAFMLRGGICFKNKLQAMFSYDFGQEGISFYGSDNQYYYFNGLGTYEANIQYHF